MASRKNTSKRQKVEPLPVREVAPHPTRAELKELLAQARERLNVTPTDEDRETARRILQLYHDKTTPPLFGHLLWQVFYDAAKHYGLKLPTHTPDHWRGFWPLLIARLRHDEYLPERISYPWDYSEEKEAELDAKEEEENQIRAVFDTCHNKDIPEDVRGRFADGVIEILDAVHPFHTWEVFSVAWPLALQALNSVDDNLERAVGEENEQIEVMRDAAAIAQILNSSHTPDDVRNALAEAVTGHISNLNDDAGYIKSAWPLAMLKHKEGSASDGAK